MSLSANEYLKRILLAPIYDVAVKTDLVKLDKLSASLGNDIWLKREDQQPVKSFKLRGAYNKLAVCLNNNYKLGLWRPLPVIMLKAWRIRQSVKKSKLLL
jgi:threonine dehydratase